MTQQSIREINQRGGFSSLFISVLTEKMLILHTQRYLGNTQSKLSFLEK